MYIYKTTNLINNKIYIGLSSRNLEDSTGYYGSGKRINLAIIKYGKDNFKKEVLQECYSKEELNNAEKYWIDFYNSTDSTIGYNVLTGGYGGGGTYERTQEIREKAKIKSKETYQKPTGESLERMRQGTINRNIKSRGTTLSEERKAIISKSTSAALTGFKYTKKTCPHCGTVGGGANMSRYHFNNCKNKPH